MIDPGDAGWEWADAIEACNYWRALYEDSQRWQRWQAEDPGHEEWAEWVDMLNREYREDNE